MGQIVQGHGRGKYPLQGRMPVPMQQKSWQGWEEFWVDVGIWSSLFWNKKGHREILPIKAKAETVLDCPSNDVEDKHCFQQKNISQMLQLRVWLWGHCKKPMCTPVKYYWEKLQRCYVERHCVHKLEDSIVRGQLSPQWPMLMQS